MTRSKLASEIAVGDCLLVKDRSGRSDSLKKYVVSSVTRWGMEGARLRVNGIDVPIPSSGGVVVECRCGTRIDLPPSHPVAVEA